LVDPAFPADGRALYFDKDCPPKGSLPSESLSWIRICSKQIERCTDPVVYQENAQSSIITQGALGNTHFVNALRHLTCEPSYINSLVVSSKYAYLGLYTLKISKAGRWRYRTAAADSLHVCQPICLSVFMSLCLSFCFSVFLPFCLL
jgi:hypothetical protein